MYHVIDTYLYTGGSAPNKNSITPVTVMPLHPLHCLLVYRNYNIVNKINTNYKTKTCLHK